MHRRRRCPCRHRSLRRRGPGRRRRRRPHTDRCRRGPEKMRWNSVTFAPHRQRRRDPRLQHAVAFDDPAARHVEARPVERMRHLADQAAHRVARQPRVGVERDDVADALGGGTTARPPVGRNVVSVAPRSSGSARAACRACAPSPSSSPGARSRAGGGAAAGSARRRRRPGRGAVELARCRPRPPRTAPRPPPRSPRRRRSSPRAARSADRPRCSRGDRPRGARSAPRRRAPVVVSSVGTTTSVRSSGGTPSRSSSAGQGARHRSAAGDGAVDERDGRVGRRKHRERREHGQPGARDAVAGQRRERRSRSSTAVASPSAPIVAADAERVARPAPGQARGTGAR